MADDLCRLRVIHDVMFAMGRAMYRHRACHGRGVALHGMPGLPIPRWLEGSAIYSNTEAPATVLVKQLQHATQKVRR